MRFDPACSPSSTEIPTLLFIYNMMKTLNKQSNKQKLLINAAYSLKKLVQDCTHHLEKHYRILSGIIKVMVTIVILYNSLMA